MFEILSIDTKSWTETENVSARNFFTNIIQSGSMNFDHIWICMKDTRQLPALLKTLKGKKKYINGIFEMLKKIMAD